MSGGKALRVAAAGIVTVVILGFVGAAMADAVRAIDLDLLTVRWEFIVPAFVVQLGTIFALPWLWLRVLNVIREHSGDRLPRGSLLLAFSRSWLARYLPGRVWYVGGRSALGLRQGIDALTLGRSMFLEIAFSYGTLAILGLGFFLWVRVGPVVGILFAGVACIGLGVVIPLGEREMRRIGSLAALRLPLVNKLVPGSEGAVKLRVRDSLWLIGAYAAHSALQAAGFLLLVFGLLGTSTDGLAVILSAWLLGSLAGYLAFLVPAGLGVREAVTLFLLADVLGPPEAALIAAGSRIMLIASDVAFVLIVEATAALMHRAAHPNRLHQSAPKESGAH